MQNNIERDFIGYANNPPIPNWPKQARVVVSFVINYEEGAERNILDGDDRSENYLCEIPSLASRIQDRHSFVENIFEYGSRVGIWRLLHLFNAYDVKTTLWAVGLAVAKNPQAMRAFAESGHEIAGHAYRWIDYYGIDREIEEQHITQTLDIIEQVCGQRPQGWYTGRHSENTRSLIQKAGLRYDSDYYADDLPVWFNVNNQPFLVIPYSLISNDCKYMMSPGFSSPYDFYQYLKMNFDCLYREGQRYPKMMTVALHARISGQPGRCEALHYFLEHIKKFDNVWIAKRIEIAQHWIKYHPTQ